MSYDTAKQYAQSPDVQDRRRVAADVMTVPEILYFLVDDEDVSVRRRVAENRATPRQADLKLTADKDEAVRLALASKISALVPDLPLAALDKVQELTIEVLRQLARDQAVRVREILAETLQSVRNVPPDIIATLARDAEIRVAEPVLKSSPLLSDDDLLTIIKSGPIAGALAAIAKRPILTETVTSAISSSADTVAIAALLANCSAQIREDVLDQLCAKAQAQPSWHEPLVHRPRLPLAAIRRLAAFVAAHLLEALKAQPAVDEALASEIAELVRSRISGESEAEDPAAQVKALAASGKLDEPAITAALEAGQRRFVIAALALLAGTDAATVTRIIAAHSAKGMTALAWRAKLSMRLALQLQTRLAGITPQQALYPKDGALYPLPDEDMKWQLEFFGITA
jgi:uncharacterized protein (DUF2336 family)